MRPEEFPKTYNAAEVEDGIYNAWMESGFFNPDNLPGERKEAFAIMMPPPNVTGILHLGHALENALMDTMARFERMRGKRVLLIPGTDHAAIPTQAKVEKLLQEQGMEHPRQDLGREELLRRIRAFADSSQATILKQIRKMGTSCDWSRMAYTFDEARSRAVNELFCRMYKDGLVYRGYRVVNWSVKGQSTSSDDEIEYVERPAKLYTFRYSKDFPIKIATTRPETKLGDTAVAVHPDDARYRAYVGQTFVADVGAAKPLSIKIIADTGVDPAFGTGALGVTPAHSPTDFALYEKQKAAGDPIDLVAVIGPDGNMTEAAGPSYAGLSVEDARTKFIAWLSAEGLLEKEEDIVQNVGTSDRYKDVIEAIPMTQWWLDVQKPIPGRGKSLRDLMHEAVTSGIAGDASKRVVITPERFTKMYLDRVKHLRDWCLSRQIWWGHRIPVWYRGEETSVGAEAPKGDGWQQDPDTLDTWFSSGSWTFSTLGWPSETRDLKDFHPTAWMQMGYEIVYLWLMRMILMSAYVFDDVPFREAYIHGMVRDEHGQKFSKSAENGIDPLDAIRQFGCDALRVSILSGTTPGNDSAYYEEKIEAGRNLVNKLWNIARFILSTVGRVELRGRPSAQTLSDRWILSRLEETSALVTRDLETFQFSAALEALREFTWSDFADWYVEIAKVEGEKDTVLLYVLERLLVLWHPFMPFVTEEIWKQFDTGTFLLVHTWPDVDQPTEPRAEEDFRLLHDLIVAIRNVRTEHKVEPKVLVDLVVVGPEEKLVLENLEIVKRLARVQSVAVGEALDRQASSIRVVVGATDLYVILPAGVEVDESAKKRKEFDEAAAYLAVLEGKLANKEFLAKAPPAVVESLKQKYAEAKQRVSKLS